MCSSDLKMWYRGFDGANYRVGYATSADGITWSKDAGNPVLDLGVGGQWDDNDVLSPAVIKDGGTYEMWYNGFDGAKYRVGYATSADGVTWTKDAGNPVLDIGTGGAWDNTHITYPGVIKDGGTYKMWYSGDDGTNIRIGLANSSDGVGWTKGAGRIVVVGTAFDAVTSVTN